MLYRLFDIVIASLALTILFPICLLIAVFIKLESKGPVLFKQKRVGKNECPYHMFKFRSMYLHDDTPESLGPIKHKHRLVTKVGYIIRRFKLDEIPQFLNVLRGDMSMCGPRPCLFSKIETMTHQERRRFDVLPGMTSWAEVNGNVELDWSEQLMLDLWFVDHKTLGLYWQILGKTAVTVIFGSVKNQEAIQQAKEYLISRTAEMNR